MADTEMGREEFSWYKEMIISHPYDTFIKGGNRREIGWGIDRIQRMDRVYITNKINCVHATMCCISMYHCVYIYNILLLSLFFMNKDWIEKRRRSSNNTHGKKTNKRHVYTWENIYMPVVLVYMCLYVYLHKYTRMRMHANCALEYTFQYFIFKF